MTTSDDQRSHMSDFATPRHLWPLLLTAACSAPTEDSFSAAQPTPQPAAISVEDWTPETIALPPGFAPELPSGVEVLRFAPGMFEPGAEDFWSYAFILWIDEPAPDGPQIQDMLEAYYDGLLAAVGGSDPRIAGKDPAQVQIASTGPHHFEGQIQIIDTFVTYEPVQLQIVVDTEAGPDGNSALRIQASPQPKDHDIWRSLEAALASIEKP